MTDTSTDNAGFGKALTYTANVPLAWSVTDRQDAGALSLLNEQRLRTILNLSEYHGQDVSEEFALLERKVDITLEMVATLLRTSVDMPETKFVQLGAHELQWQETGQLPVQGTRLDVAVYLHDCYPKPLILPGTLDSVIAQTCKVSLVPQSDDVQQLLEKFIFLHHRRAIAQSRQP